MTDWAAKLFGATARIAGLLHVTDHAEDDSLWQIPISDNTTRAAILIAEYLIPHAKAAFSLMAQEPIVADASHVLTLLRHRAITEFTKREVFEITKGRFKKVERLEPALDLPEQHFFIRKAHQPVRNGPGRKSSPAYEVNPGTHVRNSANTTNSANPGMASERACDDSLFDLVSPFVVPREECQESDLEQSGPGEPKSEHQNLVSGSQYSHNSQNEASLQSAVARGDARTTCDIAPEREPSHGVANCVSEPVSARAATTRDNPVDWRAEELVVEAERRGIDLILKDGTLCFRDSVQIDDPRSSHGAGTAQQYAPGIARWRRFAVRSHSLEAIRRRSLAMRGEETQRRIYEAGTDLSVMRTDDVTAAAGIAPDDAQKLFRMIVQAKYRLGSGPDERETPTQGLRTSMRDCIHVMSREEGSGESRQSRALPHLAAAIAELWPTHPEFVADIEFVMDEVKRGLHSHRDHTGKVNASYATNARTRKNVLAETGCAKDQQTRSIVRPTRSGRNTP